MNKVLVSVFVLGLATVASAQNVGYLGLGFVAPQIDGRANVSNPAIGEIIFDAADSKFFGRDATGWVELSAAGESVTSSGTGEKLERVSVTSTCSSSPCTIARQSGGTTSVTRSGTGAYSVNFDVSTFPTGAPACVVSIRSGGSAFGVDNVQTSTSAVTFSTFNNAGTAQDSAFHVICMGN